MREGLEAAVREAGEAILAVVARGRMRVGHKWGEGPVTEADYAADEVLHERLMPLIPGAHWLSEESEQIAPLIRGEPTWVVDPLDGTREFVQGIPEYGVSVGLFVNDRLVLGAVGLPAEGNAVLSGLVDGERREARREGETIVVRPPEAPTTRVVISRHDYRYRAHYRLPPGYEVYPMGSAAVKLVHAADGAAGIYFSTGPRTVWDAAGGAAVLEAAGGVLLQWDGRPLTLSPRRVEIPPYVAGDAEACARFLRLLRLSV